MRLRTWILVLALLAMSIMPALAQDAPWFAYVYNGRDLVRVYSDERQETYNAGLPENAFVSAAEMTFSADGSRVAYCALTYDQTVSDPAQQSSGLVVLRDIAAQSNLLELDMGHPIACRTGEHASSPDERLLAVALINYLPGSVDSSLPAWQLLVLDATTGDVVYEINDQFPTFANPTPHGATMPFVSGFEANQVIFSPVPYFTEGFPDTAYRWHLDTGNVEVEPGEQWEQFLIDTLESTGEHVWIAADPNLAAVQPMGPVPPYNVVRIADSSGAARTVLHVGEATPGEVQFINNGQQIAVMLMPVFDETQPNAPVEYRWIALDRAGSVTDLVTDTSFTNLDGAPGGYVRVIGDLSNMDNAMYRLEYTSNGQTTELWSSTLPRGDRFAAWELAWVTPMPAAEGLPPFPAIG